MDRQKYLHGFIEEELQRYEKLHARLQKELGSLPQGSLVTNRYDDLCRCIRVDGVQCRIVIPPDDHKLITALKKRRYIRKGLKLLDDRITNCQKFLEEDTFYDPRKIERELPTQYRGMEGIDIFLDGDINVEDWIRQPYHRNPAAIEIPHYTAGGILVRSKSEAMIGTRLEARRVLYRPEPPIWTGTRNVYPDFEIFHAKRRRLVYWEHLGKIDEEGYIFSNLRKLEEYAKCGLVLGKNLFITYESQKRPLGMATIDAKLEEILRS